MKKIAMFVFLAFVMTPADGEADQFNIDGYNVTIGWKQQMDKVTTWGGVTGGQKCKQLNLTIFLQNSKESRLAHLEAAIRNYNPSRTNRFKAADTVYQNIHNRKYWHVDEIYTNCLQ